MYHMLAHRRRTAIRRPAAAKPTQLAAASMPRGPVSRAPITAVPRSAIGECPERLADRGRLVPELRFAGPGGFAIRSADEPVVSLHHHVGEEHLPTRCDRGGPVAGWRRRNLPAGFELLEPDEPRHAGVGRLFERDPVGDVRFDPPLRIHQHVGADPHDFARASRTTSSTCCRAGGQVYTNRRAVRARQPRRPPRTAAPRAALESAPRRAG